MSKILKEFTEDKNEIYSVDFSQDNQLLATASSDGNFRLYSLPQTHVYKTLSTPSTRPATSIQFNPNPKFDQLITTQVDGLVTSFNQSGVQKHAFQLQNELYQAKFAPDGTQYGLAGRDRKIHIIDAKTSAELIVLHGGNASGQTTGHTNRVFGLVFDQINHNLIYSAGWDNTVQIWDIRVGNSVQSISNVQICGDSLDICGDKLLAGNWRTDDALQIFDLRNVQTQLKTVFEPKYDYSKAFNEQIAVETIPADCLQSCCFNPKISHFVKIDEELKQNPEYRDPTLVYTARFNQAKPELVIAGGSGGNCVKIFNWEKNEVMQQFVAPASCFCSAVSGCGRFGVFGGSGFGLQMVSFE